MKWINAEQKVTVTIYDEEHEEHHDKIMTVEEMLDTYTNEGCPTVYSNSEPKRGRWMDLDDEYTWVKCSLCGNEVVRFDPKNFCPNCGARMEE